MRRYEGRIALVTGAAGGIGRAVARRLLDEGAAVVLCDRDEPALAALAAELGPSAGFVAGDVADEADVRRSIRVALERHGRLDVAVLGAGTEGTLGRIGEISAADFDRVIAVNLRGVFLGLSAIMPAMAAGGGGAIAILSSTAGLRGAVGLSPYVASKHAVVGLMRSAALEGAAAMVRVNSVNPGPIDTRMMRSIECGLQPDAADAVRARIAQSVPMRRYGTPEEVAALVAFLCSDEASFCSGGVYGVDGAGMAGRS